MSPVKVARAEMPVPPAPSTGPAESTASPVPSLLFDSDADEYFDDLLVFLDGLEDETAEPEC